MVVTVTMHRNIWSGSWDIAVGVVLELVVELLDGETLVKDQNLTYRRIISATIV